MYSFVTKTIIIGTVLGGLYVLWGGFISLYHTQKLKKNIPFECGFLPFSISRIPFSLRFFFLLILFVVFDLEMSLFLQLPFQVEDFFLKNRVLFLVFFLFLAGCLFEEWRRGVLSWL